jgi:hypothetical protein
VCETRVRSGARCLAVGNAWVGCTIVKTRLYTLPTWSTTTWSPVRRRGRCLQRCVCGMVCERFARWAVDGVYVAVWPRCALDIFI